VDARETAEIEALRAMFAAVPGDVRRQLGVETVALGEAIATRIRELPGSTEVNHAIGISTAEQLEPLSDFYGETRHAVSPAPGVDLDTELRAHGYEPGYAWMKFARGTEPAPEVSTELRVVEVDAGTGADFGRTAVEAYGLPRQFAPWFGGLAGRPGWHCFVAYASAEPAATGALHVSEGLAWLGMGATRLEHRRRGAQSALLAARVRRAIGLGCTLLVTETGELVGDRPSASYRNILRTGFEPQYVRPNYVPAA
jgi:hypothetical protein